MNLEEFKSSLKGKTVLADFGASWCGPCQSMAPVIKELAEAYKGRAGVMEIDIDSEKRLATELMIQSIPTLIVFKDGIEIRRLVGLQSQGDIKDCLNRIL